MYHAKQAGRNNYKFYTPAMNVEAQQRLLQESQLKHAVKNNEFVNHYQPIIDAYEGKVVGFELLLRWEKEGQLIFPDRFITLSEEMGLIIIMTEAAITRGVVALKQWHKIKKDLYLSINIASQHFSKDSLLPYIEKVLLDNQLPASALRLEVTENAFISSPEKAIKTMEALSKLGITLALDDFGTGFSSLAYLKQLPLDVIKIDRSFVAGIGVNITDEAIVDTTLVLAKRLNMQCIAEGVETQQQLAYLGNQQCHIIQGYFYYKPMSTKKILSLLTSNKTEIINKPE
jgi:EAL domain-containing protein (putative c-di-GMP-specific phosphodiesterase class I)